MRICLLLCWLFGPLSLVAQDIPMAAIQAIDSFELEWPQLLSAPSAAKIYEPAAALDYTFPVGINVPRENYRVLAFFQKAGVPQIPHIKATLKANHFAKNLEDSYIAIHTLTAAGLEDYGADWGAVYYFKPKLALPAHQECQLVCLYKTDVGAVYLLYLFDDFVPAVEEMIWNPVFKATKPVE